MRAFQFYLDGKSACSVCRYMDRRLVNLSEYTGTFAGSRVASEVRVCPWCLCMGVRALLEERYIWPPGEKPSDPDAGGQILSIPAKERETVHDFGIPFDVQKMLRSFMSPETGELEVAVDVALTFMKRFVAKFVESAPEEAAAFQTLLTTALQEHYDSYPAKEHNKHFGSRVERFRVPPRPEALIFPRLDQATAHLITNTSRSCSIEISFGAARDGSTDVRLAPGEWWAPLGEQPLPGMGLYLAHCLIRVSDGFEEGQVEIRYSVPATKDDAADADGVSATTDMLPQTDDTEEHPPWSERSGPYDSRGGVIDDDD